MLRYLAVAVPTLIVLSLLWQWSDGGTWTDAKLTIDKHSLVGIETASPGVMLDVSKEKPTIYPVYDADAGAWTLRGTKGNVNYSKTLNEAARIIEATPGNGAMQTAKWVRVAAKFWAGVERDVKESLDVNQTEYKLIIEPAKK